MTALPAALLLALLSQAPASPTPPEGPSAIRFAADDAPVEVSEERMLLRGHAMVANDNVTVRADEITLDRKRQVAVARGHVVMVSGLLGGVADEMDVNLATAEATLGGGLFMQKSGVTEQMLLEARSQEELKALGKTTMTLSGSHVQRVSAEQFLVDGISFTPCDCNALEPTWRITASHADVMAGERALLTWPVVYVHKVPVFAFPWLYLPLSHRRSGLLIPKPTFGGTSGFGLDVPVFLTLGESADLTLTPGFSLGPAVPRDAQGEPLPNANPLPGVSGPRLAAELRYVPSERTGGLNGLPWASANFSALYDFTVRRDPLSGAPLEGNRGFRWQGTWQHLSDWDHGFGARWDLNAFSDASLPRELTTNLLVQATEYVRSTAVAFRRGENSYLGLSAVLRQDLGVASQGGWGYGLFAADGPRTLQELPSLSAAIPESRLLGPLFGSIRADVTRIAPIGGGMGDVCLENAAAGPECTLPLDQRGPAEREGRIRLDLAPRLSASWVAGDVLRFSPYATYRQDIWLGEVSQDVLSRGYGLLGAVLDSEISGDFRGLGLRHVITPSVEFRYVPAVFGNGPSAQPLLLSGIPVDGATRSLTLLPYDAIDAAVPSEGLAQGIAMVSQRLMRRGPGFVTELARLDLGASFDLKRPEQKVATLFARTWLSMGPLLLEGRGSYDVAAKALEGVLATASLTFKRARVAVAYEMRAETGYEQSRRPLDALVGPLVAGDRRFRHNLDVGGSYVFGFGLGLRYQAWLLPGQIYPPTGIPRSPSVAEVLAQQQFGVSYGPSCDCWRIEAAATVVGREGTGIFSQPTFNINLVLQGFGSIGSG